MLSKHWLWVIVLLVVLLSACGGTVDQARDVTKIEAPPQETEPGCPAKFPVVESNLLQDLLAANGGEVLGGQPREEEKERLLMVPVAWGPDDNSLYFLLYVNDLAADLEVWRYDPAGASYQKIAVIPHVERYRGYHLGLEVPDSRWSPDGEKLAFTLDYAWGQYDLVVLDVAVGKTLRVINRVPAFDWQPDGDALTFVQRGKSGDKGGLLFVYDLKKDRARELAGFRDRQAEDIAYDSRGRLYFTSGEHVFMAETPGSEPLTTGAVLLPSPDRTYLLVLNYPYQNNAVMKLLDTATSQVTILPIGKIPSAPGNVRWGGDHSLQVFGNHMLTLFQVREKHSEQWEFPKEQYVLFHSPDNTRVLISQGSAGQEYAIVRINRADKPSDKGE